MIRERPAELYTPPEVDETPIQAAARYMREHGACEGKLPGHEHCRHGHIADCPIPGDCEVA